MMGMWVFMSNTSSKGSASQKMLMQAFVEPCTSWRGKEPQFWPSYVTFNLGDLDLWPHSVSVLDCGNLDLRPWPFDLKFYIDYLDLWRPHFDIQLIVTIFMFEIDLWPMTLRIIHILSGIMVSSQRKKKDQTAQMLECLQTDRHTQGTKDIITDEGWHQKFW